MIKLKRIQNRLVVILIIITNLSCQEQHHNLPILSKYIDDSGKTIDYKVEGFNFTDQLGQPFTENRTNGKVYVANFFFTSCSSICPPMRNKLINLLSTIKDDDFFVASFSINPDFDSIDKLFAYSKNTTISPERWVMLNGSEQELKTLANLFRTSFKPIKNNTDFYHSSYVALVDRKHRIRGFYEILKKEDFEKLIKDSKQLLK